MTLGCRAAASLRVDTGVVDHRIHASDCVDLICDAPGLGGAAEVADYDPSRTQRELGENLGPIRRSGVQHHFVAVIKERLRRRAAEPIRAAGDEDNSHQLPYRCVHLECSDH